MSILALSRINENCKCSDCKVFSRLKSGFCPKSEVEVSKDHPACSLMETFKQELKTKNENDRHLHIHDYESFDCKVADPNHCPLCPEYLKCKLVLDAVKKSINEN